MSYNLKFTLFMNLHKFIFTNKPIERYYRHIIFWLIQLLFWILSAGIFFATTQIWVDGLIQRHGYFLLQIIYTYLIVYYFSPKYLLKKEYSKFAVAVLVLTIITYFLFALNILLLRITNGLPKDRQILYIYFSALDFVTMGPPIVCAMFLTCKMLKNYYLKMEEKATLIKETGSAELQLLKAQIHPHFLFNTLNNIYSFNLNKSPKAADLVMKLTDTLKYMVNDCDADLVPLEKELKMIQDYIGLEKVRYGKRLNMKVEIKGDSENKLITPLLLIPFVENSFKHGASKMLENPWIKLNISIEQNTLLFNLSNSKPTLVISSNGKNGIGLINVQKRLKLLYPGNHVLTINDEGDSFQVQLSLPLHHKESDVFEIVQPVSEMLSIQEI